jgi:aspartyl-tRNA(Asn)/glutamyl-tRNA(Gln) amidotransferase subunit A
VRALIARDFARAFAEVDAIVAPVSPFPAFKLGEKIDDPLAMYLSDIYTITGSLAGIPCMSVPCGKTAAEGCRWECRFWPGISTSPRCSAWLTLSSVP